MVVFLFSPVLLFTCFVCIISQIQPQLVLFNISLVSPVLFFFCTMKSRGYGGWGMAEKLLDYNILWIVKALMTLAT